MIDSNSFSWQLEAAERAGEAPESDQLIERCLAGDEAAYGVVYRQYAGMIYRLCFNMLQHREDAEEVMQDSFEYAFRRLQLFDASKSAFTTWLYRIAISRCRNKRRRKWLPTFSIQQIISDDKDVVDQEAASPLELAQLTEEQKQIWLALQQLSPKLKETAILRYYEGLRYPEIAVILDIPAKTAESRMRLAHKQLRELLNSGE